MFYSSPLPSWASNTHTQMQTQHTLQYALLDDGSVDIDFADKRANEYYAYIVEAAEQGYTGIEALYALERGVIRPGAFLYEQGYLLLNNDALSQIEKQFEQYLGEVPGYIETIWDPETRTILTSGWYGHYPDKNVCFIWEQDPDLLDL